MKHLGLPFSVLPSGASEELTDSQPLTRLVVALAERKAAAVADNLDAGIVVGADTAIGLDNAVLGKPTDRAHATRMLQSLRGRDHTVATGVAVIDAHTKRIVSDFTTATITMRDYTDEETRSYVATAEPFDKAGSYAIQGAGRDLVAHLDGSLDTAIGLPLELVRSLLREVVGQHQT